MVLFTNGYLYLTEQNGVTYDEKGNVVVPAVSEEEKIPCQIDGIPALTAIREGNTIALTATVYINYTDIKEPENFHPSQVHLFHNKRGDLGTFIVKTLEYYDLTQAFVLTV